MYDTCVCVVCCVCWVLRFAFACGWIRLISQMTISMLSHRPFLSFFFAPFSFRSPSFLFLSFPFLFFSRWLPVVHLFSSSFTSHFLPLLHSPPTSFLPSFIHSVSSAHLPLHHISFSFNNIDKIWQLTSRAMQSTIVGHSPLYPLLSSCLLFFFPLLTYFFIFLSYRILFLPLSSF